MSAQELGSIGDPAVTRAESEAIAATLRAAGINLNLAPVVDLNTNPDNPVIGGLERSFSADPEVVAEQAAAFIEGHRAQRILTALKHSPGHGNSVDDSHLGFVDVTETWSEAELEPYRALVDAGLADIVMAAHVFNSNIDPVFRPPCQSQRSAGCYEGSWASGALSSATTCRWVRSSTTGTSKKQS
ncbi:MAG: glycoside hydrolase family 3 N-terminal domain-containing protein [Dehalococcoidia bacterium]